MTHLESIALRHAKALGHAQSVLAAIRVIGAASTHPIGSLLSRKAAEAEAEIARLMQEETE